MAASKPLLGNKDPIAWSTADDPNSFQNPQTIVIKYKANCLRPIKRGKAKRHALTSTNVDTSYLLTLLNEADKPYPKIKIVFYQVLQARLRQITPMENKRICHQSRDPYKRHHTKSQGVKIFKQNPIQCKL